MSRSAGSSDGADDSRSTAPDRAPGEVSKWEWLAGAVGLVLLLAVVSFILRAAMQPATPPLVIVAVDSITSSGGTYLVHFTARNDGRTAAASVTVEGELRSGSGTPTRSEVTLEFVPASSSRSGGLYFRDDPRRGQLVLRPLGYADP